MIGRIYAVALTTFREAIRMRILYALLVLVAGAMLMGIVVGQMSLHEEARTARDIGLGTMSLFGCLIAIIMGVLLLYSEVKKRTIHSIVSKPIERHEFVVGKYLGVAGTLTVVVAVLTMPLLGLLAIQGAAINASVFKAVLLVYQEILVVAAIAIFFSSFSTPLLSGVFTAGIWLIGRATPEIRALIDSTEFASGRLSNLYEGALYVIPDLHIFSPSGGPVDGQHVSVHGDFVTWGYVGTAAGSALLLIAVFVVLAMAIFSRRDFV